METIAYCGGTWSPNIGNAFFNLGIMHALKLAKPESNVVFLPDPPGWNWSYGRKPENPNILLDDLECDYILVSGPLFCSWLEPIWGNTLRKLKKKGTKIVFISAGSMEYSEEEYNQVMPFVKEIEPYMLVTRDSDTFDRYSGLFEKEHDGICFSLFAKEYFTEFINTEYDDINICFDKGLDYNVLIEYEDEIRNLLTTSEWNDSREHKKLKRSKKASKLDKFYDYRIVRPHHVANPRFRTILKSFVLGYRPFVKPNTYIADIPEGYLHLYKNSKLTISERVHACAPAISFGNYAWLVSETKRSRLFDRIGLGDVTNHPVKADQNLLDTEKSVQIEFLRNNL